MSVWELCDLGPAVEGPLSNLSDPTNASTPSSGTRRNLKDLDGVKPVIDGASGAQQGVQEIQSHFGDAESSCRNVLEEVDSILAILEDISNEYEDVTSRTNSLVMNCESLLEQQRELEATVEKLHGVLGPFKELEQVALLLGVPFDPHMNPADGENDSTTYANKSSLVDTNKRVSGNTISDPRSPEFRQALHRLAKASAQVDQHPEFQDAGKYRGWLGQLQSRALGLISRGIRNLLDNAAQQASDLMAMAAKQRKMAAGSSISLRGSQATTALASDEQPLESAAIYKKFRSLSFRVRELVSLLEPSAAPVLTSPATSPIKGGRSEEEGDTLLTLGNLAESSTALREVTSSYVSLRTKLLTPFLNDILKQAAIASGLAVKAGSRAGSPRNGRGTPTNISATGSSDSLTSTGSADSGPGSSAPGRGGALCGYLRQAFANLHRVAQLELQLYESLFSDEEGLRDGGGVEVMKTSNTGSKTDYREALAVVEAAGSVVSDALRPPIIHEDSVDELCRVISVLGEDVRAHTINARLPIQLRKELLRGLDKTISDAQERLNYCAEISLRQGSSSSPLCRLKLRTLIC